MQTLSGQKKNTINQSDKSKSIEAFYQNGRLLQTNSFVRGHNSFHESIDDFQAFSLRFKWHTNGSKLWEQVYNNPEYGIGFFMGNFDHSPELGNPIAVYGFFSSPIFKTNNFSINYDAGFGLTFNWESFELGQNANNIAIGAEQSVYIDLGLKLKYQLSKNWSIGAGVSFTHFSNGALKKPNMGINTLAPKLLLSYDITRNQKNIINDKIPPFQPKNNLSVSTYFGLKNVLYERNDVDTIVANKGVYYPIYGLSSVIDWQLTYKSKVGLGMTFGYFGAANSILTAKNGKLIKNNASLKDGFEISIFPSYELLVSKVSLVIQPGLYIYRRKYENQTPRFYQRIGLKYNFWRKYFVGINLHAYNFYVSDYIEWHIGCCF